MSYRKTHMVASMTKDARTARDDVILKAFVDIDMPGKWLKKY